MGKRHPYWAWDNQGGQEVMDELVLRWRERARALYASVDPSNDAEREAAKFNWLEENDYRRGRVPSCPRRDRGALLRLWHRTATSLN